MIADVLRAQPTEQARQSLAMVIGEDLQGFYERAKALSNDLDKIEEELYTLMNEVAVNLGYDKVNYPDSNPSTWTDPPARFWGFSVNRKIPKIIQIRWKLDSLKDECLVNPLPNLRLSMNQTFMEFPRDNGLLDADGEPIKRWVITSQTHPTCLLYTSPSPRDS